MPQQQVPELAVDLRRRFHHAPEYAARWADLPAGSRPLENPLGGAPGFQIANVWVLPGLPREMEAMFDLYAGAFRAERPIGVWPGVAVGSYPSFEPGGPTVEVVLKSSDAAALADAASWIETALAAIV